MKTDKQKFEHVKNQLVYAKLTFEQTLGDRHTHQAIIRGYEKAIAALSDLHDKFVGPNSQ